MSKYCTGARNLGHETQDCCAQHDRDYANGVERIEADTGLLVCVALNGRPWRAIAMFIVVRVFGWVRYRG